MLFIHYPLLICLLTSFLFIISMLLNMKMEKSKEKNSPYECGFDKLSKSRSMFSIQFFIIAITFIIFDVEMSIILPFSIIKNWTNMWKFNLSISLIIFLLILGIIYEWKNGALEWLK